MESINGKIHATLNNLVNGSLRTYLQDPIITMRGDRYCLPVKAEYRGQVHGLIPVSYTHLDVYKRQERGLVLMVTYSDLFTFVIMLCAVITLVVTFKRKK